ncbi:MAG: hypothetical protein ABSF11_00490 [Methylocella sp.]
MGTTAASSKLMLVFAKAAASDCVGPYSKVIACVVGGHIDLIVNGGCALSRPGATDLLSRELDRDFSADRLLFYFPLWRLGYVSSEHREPKRYEETKLGEPLRDGPVDLRSSQINIAIKLEAMKK